MTTGRLPSVEGGIQPTLLTTTGDTIYAVGANTPARLGIGSTGQVLTVAGGVPTWASAGASATSFALLNTGGTALTGASTITVSGLSGYNKLMGLIITASSNSTNSDINLRLNADSTTNYKYAQSYITGNSTYSASQISAGWADWTFFELAEMSNSASSTVSGGFVIDGANSSGIKTFSSMCGADPQGSVIQKHKWVSGAYSGTSVISSISILSGAGNFDGGTLFIYGA
jgi:hypothetical protein